MCVCVCVCLYVIVSMTYDSIFNIILYSYDPEHTLAPL